MFSNKDIAHLLRSIAAVYLLKNENRFRIIAYERAADTVEHLNRELKDVWADGKLTEVPGIGTAIASHLDEYFREGKSRHFTSVLKRIPKPVFILMRIPTIGPKKAYKLVQALKLENESTAVAELKKAALTDKIAEIADFGAKSQQEILNSIQIFEKRAIKEDRMPLPYAFTFAKEMIEYLKKNDLSERVDVLGSLRRMTATIGDIDIAVQTQISKRKSQNYKKIIDYFIHYPKTLRVDNAGEEKASIIVSPNVRIDLRLQDKKSYGAMLQYFTGSKAHNINLREFALKKGYSLSEYGIKDVKKKKLRLFEGEEEFYKFLGLQFIPPELREGTNEIELARKNTIPELVKLEDIKGDLHLHSSYDLKPSHDLGKNSFVEIATLGNKLGYEYVGFSDHNPKISYLSEEEIVAIMEKRKKTIDQLLSIKKIEQSNYFIGIESDILSDGKLALPYKALEFVDYVIASIHSRFDMDSAAMTARVIKALETKKVRILGHPTGRLFGTRDGFQMEWEKIFATCKKNDIALEINCWPLRLDLPDSLVREAIESGVKLVISTDAHANSEMNSMFYGVEVARRGWAKKSDIMNTLPYQKFKEWLLRR